MIISVDAEKAFDKTLAFICHEDSESGEYKETYPV